MCAAVYVARLILTDIIIEFKIADHIALFESSDIDHALISFSMRI